MQESKHSLYEQLEKEIETIVEFFTLRKEMAELPYQFKCDGELQDVLSKTKYVCSYIHQGFALYWYKPLFVVLVEVCINY